MRRHDESGPATVAVGARNDTGSKAAGAAKSMLRGLAPLGYDVQAKALSTRSKGAPGKRHSNADGGAAPTMPRCIRPPDVNGDSVVIRPMQLTTRSGLFWVGVDTIVKVPFSNSGDKVPIILGTTIHVENGGGFWKFRVPDQLIVRGALVEDFSALVWGVPCTITKGSTVQVGQEYDERDGAQTQTLKKGTVVAAGMKHRAVEADARFVGGSGHHDDLDEQDWLDDLDHKPDNDMQDLDRKFRSAGPSVKPGDEVG